MLLSDMVDDLDVYAGDMWVRTSELEGEEINPENHDCNVNTAVTDFKSACNHLRNVQTGSHGRLLNQKEAVSYWDEVIQAGNTVIASSNNMAKALQREITASIDDGRKWLDALEGRKDVNTEEVAPLREGLEKITNLERLHPLDLLALENDTLKPILEKIERLEKR